MDQDPSTDASGGTKKGNVFSKFGAWWLVLVGISVVFAINFAPMVTTDPLLYEQYHWLVVVVTLFGILLPGLMVAGIANLLTGRTMTHRQFMWVVSAVVALIMTPRSFQAAKDAYARFEHNAEFRAFHPHIYKLIEPRLNSDGIGYNIEGRISNQTPKTLKWFKLRIELEVPNGNQTTSLAHSLVYVRCHADPGSIAQFKSRLSFRDLPLGQKWSYEIIDAKWE